MSGGQKLGLFLSHGTEEINTKMSDYIRFRTISDLGQNLDLGQYLDLGQNLDFGQYLDLGQNLDLGQYLDLG